MNPTPTPITLSMREMATAHQVSTILSVLGMTITAMSTTKDTYTETSTPGTGESLPAEAVTAAEVTFMTACDRLDIILKDDSRWDSKFQEQVEADYRTAMAENLASLRAQRKAAEESMSPHFRLSPQLLRMKDLAWAAVKGNPNTPNSIIGIGPTPEEALLAFDEAFAGRHTKFTQEWLAKNGVDNNEQNELDTDRRPETTQPPPGGKNGKRNRRRPGKGGTAGDKSGNSSS